jgi:predicted aminopeptidase
MRGLFTFITFAALLLQGCALGMPAGARDPVMADSSGQPFVARSDPSRASLPWTARLFQAWTDGPAYYAQAIRGHLSLWWRAQPLEALIDAPQTDPKLKDRLVLARTIRQFAAEQLALPDNGSYTRYVELGRPHVVWNVKATPELSLEPRRWCFPVAGCVAYRGFYERADAEAFAERLRAQGDDVLVAGVPAYSTLGWMADPLLSSFIRYPEPDLAALIFHELAHQRLYVKGDTLFNESFATAVEIIGVRRWLEHRATAAEGASLLASWQARRARREAFLQLLAQARERLDRLYRSGAEPAALRAGKQAEIENLQAEWLALRARWGGGHGYDRWFDQDIGNAHLVSVALYTDLVPALLAMAEQYGDDLQRFYRELDALAREPAAVRSARLKAIQQRSQARPQE